jgi:hypothetical protein
MFGGLGPQETKGIPSLLCSWREIVRRAREKSRVLALAALVLLLCFTVAWQDKAAAEAGAEGQVSLATAEKAVAAGSGSAPAHVVRGEALSAIGKNGQAEAALHHAIQIDPKSVSLSWQSRRELAARVRSLPPRPPRIAPIAVNRIVGAYWYPHWGDPSRAAPRLAWSEAVYTPTLGYYDANDSRVVDQHIKMAVEHGVTLLVASLYESRLQGLLNERYLPYILNARYLPYIRFTVAVDLSEFGGFRDPGNLPAVLDWMQQLVFQRPSYFTIDGKPVFFVSDINLLTEHIGVEDLRAAFVAGRNHYRARYGGDVFIVGFWNPGAMSKDADNAPLFTPADSDLASCLDAVTLYNMPDAGGQWHEVAGGRYELQAPYESLASLYAVASERFVAAIQGSGARFIPSATPGFNNTRLYQHGLDNWLIVRTGSTPEGFGGLLAAMKPYIDPSINLLLVEAWNEFSEGSVVEPTVEFGSQYLDQIAEFAVQP